MPIYASAADLPAPAREALQRLLLALADSKLFLGFHYGEWTFGTPALEASIAACAMAQDEFGHLRLLHACLNTQFQVPAADLLEQRPFDEFANVPALDQPLQNWADFVAVNFLADGALTALLAALQGSCFEPVANFVDKMVAEEKHHVRNAQGWFLSLASGNAPTRAQLEQACRRVLIATVEWLGPVDHETTAALKSRGVLNTSWQEMSQQFLDWAGALAAQAQINLGLEKSGPHWRLRQPVAFDTWNPRTRRCAATQPDQTLLYHLCGSKNAIFKLGEA